MRQQEVGYANPVSMVTGVVKSTRSGAWHPAKTADWDIVGFNQVVAFARLLGVQLAENDSGWLCRVGLGRVELV